MARYIEADLFAEVMRDYFIKKIDAKEYECDVVDCNAELQKLLSEQPTADVVEVVHGEWERIPYSFAGGYRCSCCGCKSTEKHWDYCPKCGAKMDGKKVE